MSAPPVPTPPPAHLAPVPPRRAAAPGVEVLAGVPYAALPGIRPLELDLYLPVAPGPAPVVVFLHGGGWRLGSRHLTGPMYAGWSPTPFELVAQAGIAVASIDYRLTGEGCWPVQLHDAKAAVRWVRARAAQLDLDPDRIAAWGESAGGHLAALLGLTGADLDGEVGVTGPPSTASAVVAWYPPTDLAAIAPELGADPGATDSREAQLLGAALPDVPELARRASPLSYARQPAPPFLLLHGRADRLVPCSQSERLAAALTAAGNEAEIVTYDGADHMWLGAPEAASDALQRTIRFLSRALGATPVLGS